MIKLISLTLLAMVVNVHAGDELAHAKQLYFQGVESNAEALAQATQIFATLSTVAPTNATVLVYRGSLRLLEAAHSWALLRKGEMAKEGLSWMDQAVTAQPDDAEIRFIRAVSTYHLPGFFNRRAQTVADFDWLAAQVTTAVKAGRLDPTLGTAALFHEGLIQLDHGNKNGARASWQEAVAIGPKTRAGQDAAKKLASLPESP